MKRYVDVILCAVAGAILLGWAAIPGMPAWTVLSASRMADVGGVLLVVALIHAVRHGMEGATASVAAWSYLTPEAAADFAAVAGTVLLLAAATLACWRHGAALPQATAAIVFGALAIWSARSLFRTLAEGGRVEFRSHWGGLGGGLGGMELSRAATLLLIFLAASVAALAAVRPPAPSAAVAPEAGHAIIRLFAA